MGKPSSFSDSQLIEMYNMVKSGARLVDVAAKFNTNNALVGRVTRCVNFKHLNLTPIERMPRILPSAKTILERVMSAVQINEQSGCYEWTRAKNPAGYGVMQANGKVNLVTRLVYEEHYGKINDGMLILHSCDNPSCVNIAHLREGTAKDNHNDMIERNRLPRGSEWSFSKLNENDVLAILKLSENGMKVSEIAEIYKIGKWTVSDILAGRNWSWLTGINRSKRKSIQNNPCTPPTTQPLKKSSSAMSAANQV